MDEQLHSYMVIEQPYRTNSISSKVRPLLSWLEYEYFYVAKKLVDTSLQTCTDQ